MVNEERSLAFWLMEQGEQNAEIAEKGADDEPDAGYDVYLSNIVSSILHAALTRSDSVHIIAHQLQDASPPCSFLLPSRPSHHSSFSPTVPSLGSSLLGVER
jgi:hypothetical protein